MQTSHIVKPSVYAQYKSLMIICLTLLVSMFLLASARAMPNTVVSYGCGFGRTYHAFINALGIESLEPSPFISAGIFLIEEGTNTASTTASVRLPNGEVIVLELSDSGRPATVRTYVTSRTFTSITEAKQYFSQGKLTFEYTTTNAEPISFTLNVPDGAFSAFIPRIANTSAKVPLPILATSGFELSWSSFADAKPEDDNVAVWLYNTGPDFRQFTTSSYHGEPGYITLPGNARSVVIPANTFIPGDVGSGGVEFWKNILVDRQTLPGAIGYVTYSTSTHFEFETRFGRLSIEGIDSSLTASITISGSPGEKFNLQSSPNLSDWTTLSTVLLEQETQTIRIKLAGEASFVRVLPASQ